MSCVWKNPRLFSQGPDTWSFAAESEAVLLNAEMRFEEDGLLWVDLLLIPHWQKKPEITAFSLNIPLRRPCCELLHFWPAGAARTAEGYPDNSAFMPKDGLRLPFRPAVWTGNETGGLGFYMQSDQNVCLASPDEMIAFTPRGDAMDLQIRFLDETPPCWREEDRFMERALPPIPYSFGIQATPVRPMKKAEGFNRIAHLELMELETNYIPLLGELAGLGVKWVVLHEDWSIVQNFGRPADESRLQDIVQACHERKIRVMAYFGYEYATLAPGFSANFNRYCVKDAKGRLLGGWQRQPAQRDYVVCYAGKYRDEMIDRVALAMDRYHLDGIYTDGTFEPWACANTEHGCGYEDAGGRRRVTYPLLALRSHVRTLRDTVHARGGVLDAHQSSCCIPPVLGFADNYLDGEHIQPQYNKDGGAFPNAGTFRAEYTGINWGIPSQFIVFPSGGRTFAQCCGLPLLYHIDCRPFGAASVREAARIWRVLDGFGTEEAEFFPFWREDCPARTDSSSTRASCWIREGRALAVLFNAGREPEKVLLSLGGRSQSLRVEPLTPLFVEMFLK